MLLELGGESLVRRAAHRALGGGVSPLVVVLGAEAATVRRELHGLSATMVVNPDYASGITSSMRAGLRALPAVSAAVVLLGDMPHVTSEMIREMIERYEATRACVVISEYGGVRAPPILYDCRLFAELLAIADDGRGREVAERHREASEVMRWPATILQDLDVPADYERVVGVADLSRDASHPLTTS